MMERYLERERKKKRKAELFFILKKHGIKQYELAQQADLEPDVISRICRGRKNNATLILCKKICNALNDLLEQDKMMYTLHDIFGD